MSGAGSASGASVRSAARRLLPLVDNQEWFFDTELLMLAQRAGLRIAEIPVNWDEDADSRVRIIPTAIEDLRGVWRLMLKRRPRLEVVAADGA